MYASILKPGRVLAATAAIALMFSAAPATAKYETAEAKAEVKDEIDALQATTKEALKKQKK